MSWEDCIAEIRAAAGEDTQLSDRDIERMLERVIREAKRKSGIGMPDSDSIRAAARDLAEQERIAAAIEKRNARLNMVARIGRRERIQANPDGLASGIRAEIHGTTTPIAGGRFSAEAEWKALNRQYREGIVVALEHEGLVAAAQAPEMQRLWARELFELSKGRDGAPGVTGSPEALKVAEIIHRFQSLAKDNLNKAGAWIGDYAGYITRTAHDPDKIRVAGLGAWKETVRPLLDERSFDPVGERPEARERFLDNIYHALVTGVHLTHDGMRGFKDPAFAGPGNMAKRLSEERVLHFRDAEAWLDYQGRFGQGNVLESVMHALDRAARGTALMRRWGTNPRAEFEADIGYLSETHRNSAPDSVNRLREAQKDLQARFDYLDGTADMPVNRLGARVSSTLRLIESMAKLGGMLLTDFTGIVTHAAELRYQGIGLLQGYGNFLTSVVRGRGRTEETREIMDLLLAGHEGMLRDIMGRFEPDDNLPGTLSKLANIFFKLTGTAYLNAAQRAGGEFLMARHLGSLLDTDHASLPPETQRILGMFRIGAAEWNLLRHAPDRAEIEGRAFLTPDLARRIPDLAVLDHLRASGKRSYLDDADRFREELALHLHAYFNDRSEHIMIVPGIATKADLLRGTRPGTVEGEALRFVAQFKSWPVAMMRMGLGREIYGQERPAAVAGILHMALMGTLIGYGVMSLKDTIKFREPRDPASIATWGAAMAQGGGFGILGDFLFGEYSRFGRNLFETLAGPVPGETAGFAIEMWNRLKKAADDPNAKADFGANMLNWTVRNTPFLNLFYTRWALDYLFLWQVQEALNPGFLKRFERRVKEQNHQRFWLAPSSVVQSGPPPPRPRRAPAEPWGWAR